MVTNIIQIGNSKGIILPSEVLKQLRLSLKSAVSISLDGNNIVIKAQPRQGWAEAAKRAHENGDDELLIPDVFEDEKFEDWTWVVKALVPFSGNFTSPQPPLSATA